MFLFRRRFWAVLTLTLTLPCCDASIFAQEPHASSTASRPKLTGYFPQWGLYDQPQYLVKNLVTARNAPLLDQLNYAQAFITDRHCSIADPNADLNYTFTAQQSVDGVADQPTQPLRGNLNQLLKLKKLFPQIKIIISLEGRAANFAEDAQPENRQAFVASCVDLFLKGNVSPGIRLAGLFDGIDLDWEFPKPEDSANYIALLAEFRRQFNALRPGLLLNIAVGPSPRMSGGVDMVAVSGLVDEFGLMTYDYTGPWDSTTGFIAPFSSGPTEHYGTVKKSVLAYQSAGVPASKLFMGVPFYGYGWRLVPEENNGLFQEGEPIRGDRPYSQIETFVAHSTVHRNDDSQAPWLFDGDAFWTYEDPMSVRTKAAYALEQQLGGLMIWELGEDAVDAPLLRAAFDELHSVHTSGARVTLSHQSAAETVR
jgi:chitinase